MPIKLNNAEFVEAAYEQQQAFCQLLAGSQKILRIRSALLDPKLLDNRQCLDALSSFSRRSRHTKVQLLVDSPRQILAAGHGLLELSRRMSDKLCIKTYYGEPNNERDTQVISDDYGLMIKPFAADEPAIISFDDKINAAALVDEFEYDWQRSMPASVLRQLSL